MIAIKVECSDLRYLRYVLQIHKIAGGELDWGRGSERKKVIKGNSWFLSCAANGRGTGPINRDGEKQVQGAGKTGHQVACFYMLSLS